MQEKLETFELIYGTDLINHWYENGKKDMFAILIELLNAVGAFPFARYPDISLH